MSQALYTAGTGAGFFTSLATPALQTAIGIFSTATDFGLQLKKYRLGFNGVTAANAPVSCRFFTCTFATNPPGTASTSAVLTQELGLRIATTNITAAYNWTTEPTVKTYLGDVFSLTPNGGSDIYDFPYGDEPDNFVSGTTGFGLEITPAQQVGVLAALWFGRI